MNAHPPRPTGARQLGAGLLALGLAAVRLAAEGHGPAFGLATPTLGRGQWSSDTLVMALGTDAGTSVMTREWIGYGLTEDLQATVSFPLSRTINRQPNSPRTRFGAMMGAFGDVEASLLWRFQRRAPSVGARLESTLLLGGSLPTESRRGGVRVGPAVNVATVTGYASRTVYGWVGAGWQRYAARGGDRLGDLPYLSAVFGWRPPAFQHDYPKPDWRIFIESMAEFPRADRRDGATLPGRGGSRILTGPSFLGLYGKWGVEAGILLPVQQNLHGRQPEERFRAKTVFTWWF